MNDVQNGLLSLLFDGVNYEERQCFLTSLFSLLITNKTTTSFDKDIVKQFCLTRKESICGLFLLSLDPSVEEIDFIYNTFVKKKGGGKDVMHLRAKVAMNPKTPLKILKEICQLSDLSLELVVKNPGENVKKLAEVVYKILYKENNKYRRKSWRVRRLESVMSPSMKEQFEELKNIQDLLE